MWLIVVGDITRASFDRGESSQGFSVISGAFPTRRKGHPPSSELPPVFFYLFFQLAGCTRVPPLACPPLAGIGNMRMQAAHAPALTHRETASANDAVECNRAINYRLFFVRRASTRIFRDSIFSQAKSPLGFVRAGLGLFYQFGTNLMDRVFRGGRTPLEFALVFSRLCSPFTF